VSASGAKSIVLVTGLLMVAFVGIQVRNGTNQGSAYKKVWATGVLTLGLGVLSDFIPEVVGPFALLVLIAAYARNQGALGGVIGSAGKASSAAGAAHKGTSTLGPTTGTGRIGGTQ
jgi:hypothetical protein